MAAAKGTGAARLPSAGGEAAPKAAPRPSGGKKGGRKSPLWQRKGPHGEPFVPGEQGRWAVELVNGVLMSHVLGRRIPLPIDRDEYDRVLEQLAREPLPRTELA